MATKALDVATILHALKKMEDELFLGYPGWYHHNSVQEWLLPMLSDETRRGQIGKIRDITGVAILEGLSINLISVLDKTVRWKQGIANPEEIFKNGKKYPAFKLKKGCRVFRAEGLGDDPVLVIETKSGDLLYIMMAEEEKTGINLVKKAFRIFEAEKKSHEEYVWSPSAIIPKVDFELFPEIDFMLDACKIGRGVSWSIVKASQEFSFRMNEEGARARVKTEMIVMGCCVSAPIRKEFIIIDKPFIGFFVQPGVDIPLAVFYADYDSWKTGGKLADM